MGEWYSRLPIIGSTAHDDPVTGAPLLVGGYASAAAPTAVSADGDAVRAWLLRNGTQVVTLTASSGAFLSGDTPNGLDVDVTRVSGTVTVDSEFAPAITPGDTDANPTAPEAVARGTVWNGSAWVRARSLLGDGVAAGGAMNTVPMAFNGTNYDRIRGDVTNGLDVDVTRLPSLPAGTANIGDVDVLTLPALPAGSNNIGDVDVLTLPSLVAGNANIGDVDIASGPTGASALQQQGTAAQDAVIVGNPLLGGGRASTAIPTAMSADGDAVALWLSRNGALNVILRDSAGDSAMDDTNNALRVNVVAGSSGGPSEVDDAPFGVAADAVSPAAFLADETAPDPVDEGDAGIARMDLSRRQLVRVVGATDANRLDIDASGRPTVNVNGTVPVSGTVAVSTLPALVAGTANIGDVDVLSGPTGASALQSQGNAALDAAVAGNPVAIGGRASTAIPTAMSADGDAVWAWMNRNGAPVVADTPHVGLNSDPWNLRSQTLRTTTTQTSVVLLAGGASEKIVVTEVQIQVGGTTAGEVVLYYGTGAYVRATNRAIFDGEFAPSATSKPGVVMHGCWIAGTNGDDLMLTTSAAINPLTITVWYYTVT